MMNPEPKKSRKRRWIIVLILLAIALATVEWLASRMIRAKLVELVEAKLDAKLNIGTLVYLPPMGVWTRDISLARGDGDLLTIAGLRLKLAQLPWGGKPIVIEELKLNQPELKLEPQKFVAMVKPAAPLVPGATPIPRKLSDMLRLRKLSMFGGRVTYRDPRKSIEPMVWDNLSAGMALEQQSASQYRFQISSQAEPAVDASATGSLDVDSLELELRNVLLKAKVEPEPPTTPFPASVQAFIAKHKITGAAAATGEATIPLKTPSRSSFEVVVVLQDATALMPGRSTMFDHARAKLTASQSPGGSVTVQLERIDVAGEREEVLVNAGTIELNASARTWKLSGLQGQLNFQSDLSTAPSSQTTRPAQNALDRARPTGRIDFTAAASGPFDLRGKNAWDAIEHELIAYPRNLSFQVRGMNRRIEEVNEGEVRIVDGVLILQELGARYADDFFRIRSARLSLEELPDVIRWRELSGVATFNPPIRRYTPAIDPILDQLNPSGPFVIGGSFTYDRTGPKPISAYDLIVSSDTGSLTLTDRAFTIEQIRGDATVTPTDVDIPSLEGKLLGGTFHASGHFAIGDDATTYQGEMAARDVDLTKLEERLRDEQVLKPLKGRFFLDASCSGTISDNVSYLDGMHASGQFEAVDGTLFQLQVVSHISERVKGVKDAVTLGDAAAIYELNGGVLNLRDVVVNSAVLGIHGNGTIGLDSGALDLQLIAAPLADWRDKLKQTDIPLLSDVAGEIAGSVQKLLNTATENLLYSFHVKGKIGQVKVETVPVPALTDGVAYLFTRLAQPRRDERLIDVLRKEHAATQPASRSAQ